MAKAVIVVCRVNWFIPCACVVILAVQAAVAVWHRREVQGGREVC